MSAVGVKTDTNTWQQYVNNNCAEKQAINLSEVEDPLDGVDETEEIEIERENRSEAQITRESVSMASVAVVTIDLLLSSVAGIISGSNKEKYKLTDTEKSDYTEVWSNYLREKNIDLSPGAMLLITTACIVFPKLVEANRDRKERKQQDAQTETIKQQELQIMQLKKQFKNGDRQDS